MSDNNKKINGIFLGNTSNEENCFIRLKKLNKYLINGPDKNEISKYLEIGDDYTLFNERILLNFRGFFKTLFNYGTSLLNNYKNKIL